MICFEPLGGLEVSRITMSGPVFFHMLMVLLLGTVPVSGKAEVSTAKVMRGNIRRDGEVSSLSQSRVVFSYR